MTIDEAISLLKQYIDYNNPDIPDFYTMEEACEVVIKALEQQPTDAVSRQAVLDLPKIKTHNVWGNVIYESVDVENVRQLPSVTPQPKMGRWIEHFDQSGKWYECDQCHTDWGGSVNYCQNCGAKMWEIPTGAEGSDKE